MQRRRVVLVVLVIAVLTAACKGGAEEGGGVVTTTPPSTTPPPTTPPTTGPAQPTTTSTTPGTDPALVAKARAATLQKADFPTGFEPQKDEPGQGLNIDLVWQEVTNCLGVARTAPPMGVGTSPTVLRGLATQGRSTVEYTTEPLATAISTALSGPKALDCLTQSFVADVDRSKPEGARPGPVKVTARDVVAPAGQKAMSWRINASVMLDELVVPLFQDFTVVFNRGTIIRLLFLNPGSEFPQDLERTLVDKVAARA